MKDKKIYAGRINSLELYRGIALVCVIFFHTVIYNFGQLHTVNFKNPPLIIAIIGLMGMWGGIFILLSLVTTTLSILRKIKNPILHKRAPVYIAIASALYIFIHYLLSYIFGRWELSLTSTAHDYTLAGELLRNQQFALPGTQALFNGSIFSTIGLNLLLVGLLVYLLFRNPSKNSEMRAYAVLSGFAAVLFVISFTRIGIFPLVADATSSQNYILGTILGWVVAFPYPIASYALYGILGAIVGVMVHFERLSYIRRVIFPVGLLMLTVGILGCLGQPLSFNKADLFGAWKIIAELGAFTLLLVLALAIVQPRENGMKYWSVFLWFSRISLTIYLLETITSELLRHAWFIFVPNWDQTIAGTLLFGVFNVAWWFALVYLWSKKQFRYSLEYFWVKLFRRLGKRSSKLDELQAI